MRGLPRIATVEASSVVAVAVAKVVWGAKGDQISVEGIVICRSHMYLSISSVTSATISPTITIEGVVSFFQCAR